MTLKQLSDKVNVHPYDLTGDADLAEELMHEDITDTMFYQDVKAIAKTEDPALYAEMV
jgi:hypothetical protein